MLLLVDISNSRTKIATSDGTRLGPRQTVPTAGLGTHTFGTEEPDLVVLSSVVPVKSAVLYERFGDCVLEVGHSITLGVGIDYPEPDTIGADRLANAAALAGLYGTPGVVVDFGTAVTFDVVRAGGTYIGGVIAPGLDVMTDYLDQRTALLPKIDLGEPPGVVGRSTRDAMLSGTVFGYRGLVKEILGALESEIGGDAGVTVVATGGYASLIASGVPAIGAVHENLTLEGLRIIANLNRNP